MTLPAESLIIIVSGLPRSGTSLMMQMLAAGGLPVLTDGQRKADADNPRGYLEFEPVKKTREDPSWVEDAAGQAVKMVHLLLKDLPPSGNYRIVLMERDLNEVLASQQTMLDHLGKRGSNLPPERLVAVYEQQLRQIGDWLAVQPNIEALRVNHRDCIEEPSAVAARVNVFLGGGLDERAMAGVVDPDLYRQR